MINIMSGYIELASIINSLYLSTSAYREVTKVSPPKIRTSESELSKG